MKLLKGIIMTLLGFLFGSCAQQQDIISVDADAFEKAITTQVVQVVDARTASEFAEGKIAHATNIDVLSANFIAKSKATLTKDKPVYVYCRSGKRSMMAAKSLTRAGFKVVNLKGGIMGWQQAGKPIVP